MKPQTSTQGVGIQRLQASAHTCFATLSSYEELIHAADSYLETVWQAPNGDMWLDAIQGVRQLATDMFFPRYLDANGPLALRAGMALGIKILDLSMEANDGSVKAISLVRAPLAAQLRGTIHTPDKRMRRDNFERAMAGFECILPELVNNIPTQSIDSRSNYLIHSGLGAGLVVYAALGQTSLVKRNVPTEAASFK